MSVDIQPMRNALLIASNEHRISLLV